jgi:molybdate transport system ATP-binding protein
MTVDIRKSFPERLTVDVSFRMALSPPGVLILFGPSGSGKTTVLRCLAGLEWPEEGSIRFREEIWIETASRVKWLPQKRLIGFMAQDYALFPTHTVEENIAFGLNGLAAAERRRRVAEVISLLQLGGAEHCLPGQLSGGQQQRVALARAIARRPRLLLLDEPLSALDVPTRSRVRGELRSLLRQLGIPSVVVTHDWSEALALGDQLAAMAEGRILQIGTPQEVFSHPRDATVAHMVGIETVVQGRIIGSSEGLVTVEVAGSKLIALAPKGAGDDVFVCIRAEDVVLETRSLGATSARNHLGGKVRDIAVMGALVRVGIDCGFPLSAMVTRSAVEDLHLSPGMPIVAAIKAGSVHLVPRLERSDDLTANRSH